MGVIHMGFEIPFILNQVLPVASLPDRAFALVLATCVDRFGPGHLAGKVLFDQEPAVSKVIVMVGQGPDVVQVIGQDDDCVSGVML